MPAAESLLFESNHTAPEILRAPYSATQCFGQMSLQRSHSKTGHICERSVHDKVRKLLDLCHVSQVQTIKRSTTSLCNLGQIYAARRTSGAAATSR